MLTGAASAGLLLASPMRRALAQARVTVTEGNFQPIPIAIPNFVPADRATEVAAGIAQVITNNPAAQRPVRADRSGGFHRTHLQYRRAAAVCELAPDQRAGAGHGPRHAAGRWPPQGG
jgi:hypothetical protein